MVPGGVNVNQMKTFTEKGWIISNPEHLTTGREINLPSSFRDNKRNCISDFMRSCGQSHNDWHEWREFNFKCVRATRTITIEG